MTLESGLEFMEETVELFQLLVKRCPLEPIQTRERYYKACEIQAELLVFPDRGEMAQLYLDCLSLFIHAFEVGENI